MVRSRPPVALPAWFARRGWVARLAIVAVGGGALVGLIEFLLSLAVGRQGARVAGQGLFGALVYVALWSVGLAPGRTGRGFAAGLLLSAAALIALDRLWP